MTKPKHPEILYYDVHNVSKYMTHNPEKLINFSVEKDAQTYFELYESFGLNKYNVVYDRTGSVPHYLRMVQDLYPIPKSDISYNKSFFEVTEQRCKELLSLDQPINVMWSGGLDSTFVLFMLYHFANDKNQIRICGTYNSIIESGNMFDRKLKHMFQYNISNPVTNEVNYQNDGIYVSGMCGNQIFGPTDDMFATGGPAMFHHTLGTKETIYESYEKNINPEFLEFLDPAIKASPRKIETVADLRWYCIFNLDWYTAVYEHKIRLVPEKAEKIHGFFNSLEFQKWAINTKEPFTKIKGNSTTHRWQMRDILKDLFNEEHYAMNKSKKISNYNINQQNWIFLLEEYHNVFIDSE
jgi:hypothetical protein